MNYLIFVDDVILFTRGSNETLDGAMFIPAKRMDGANIKLISR